jgi:hypothetical protein
MPRVAQAGLQPERLDAADHRQNRIELGTCLGLSPGCSHAKAISTLGLRFPSCLHDLLRIEEGLTLDRRAVVGAL